MIRNGTHIILIKYIQKYFDFMQLVKTKSASSYSKTGKQEIVSKYKLLII